MKELTASAFCSKLELVLRRFFPALQGDNRSLFRAANSRNAPVETFERMSPSISSPCLFGNDIVWLVCHTRSIFPMQSSCSPRSWTRDWTQHGILISDDEQVEDFIENLLDGILTKWERNHDFTRLLSDFVEWNIVLFQNLWTYQRHFVPQKSWTLGIVLSEGQICQLFEFSSLRRWNCVPRFGSTYKTIYVLYVDTSRLKSNSPKCR